MAFDQGVTRVDNDIQEGLGVFVGIALDNTITSRLEGDFYLLVLKALFDEGERTPDYLVNIECCRFLA